MIRRLMVLLLALALVPALAGAVESKFVKGDNLGNFDFANKASFHADAKRVVQANILSHFGAVGGEGLEVVQTGTDMGLTHVRFQQTFNGMNVVGAQIVVHADASGKIFAANGEFVPASQLPLTPALDSVQAFEGPISRLRAAFLQTTEPELTYVIGNDGKAHLAWMITVEYQNALGLQRDQVFADAMTGEIAARHPQIHYARSLETRNCNQKTKNCSLVSTSSNAINTGDLAIDSAHNFAIATYNYYWNNHGRDSIDDAGMTLISRVHYDRNYNNAFWDGTQMTYGDGDGTTFAPLSQDADVVGHELTHGVTERSSGLIYSNESGALNEAWSDIFGAMVDVQEGATGADVWLVGEDIYTPGTPGDGLRDMACPSCAGDFDYYPTRYTGTSDNGGVHWNSGIANLAFKLLSTGGNHPTGATTVVVPAIGMSTAADIFYAANIGCLTPGSNFAAARYCTADVFGGSNAAAVHLAWDAVGVPNDPPPPPPPPIALTDGVTLSGQDGASGVTQQYTLGVSAGNSVTCTTSANNGDADLYVRFGAEAEPNPNSTNNDCASYSSTSNESCTTGGAPSNTTLYAAVQAFSAYNNLSITCTSGGSCSLGAPGDSCNGGGDCCSGSCSGGKPGSRTCN